MAGLGEAQEQYMDERAVLAAVDVLPLVVWCGVITCVALGSTVHDAQAQAA